MYILKDLCEPKSHVLKLRIYPAFTVFVTSIYLETISLCRVCAERAQILLLPGVRVDTDPLDYAQKYTFVAYAHIFQRTCIVRNASSTLVQERESKLSSNGFTNFSKQLSMSGTDTGFYTFPMMPSGVTSLLDKTMRPPMTLTVPPKIAT